MEKDNSKEEINQNKDDIDCYDCQFTKHKTQKNKTWQDGILVHNKTENKLCIYNSEIQDVKIDQMFKVNWKLYDISETIHFPRHLCQIERKRTTPQKFIKQKHDIDVRAIMKRKEEEEEKGEPSNLRASLENKNPKRSKTPVKGLQRKKFLPPVVKPEDREENKFHIEQEFSNSNSNYCSFGPSGFANTKRNNFDKQNGINSNQENDNLARYMQDINEEFSVDKNHNDINFEKSQKDNKENVLI